MSFQKIIYLLLATILLVVFFTHELAEVPQGVTIDEAAFGYNAVLLANTLHDQNNRFLPVFVLSIHRTDWRQPSTQYLATLLFKLFGSSVFNLRLTSVLAAVFSILLIYFLGKQLLGILGGIAAALALVSAPCMMIQSHLGLDSIMPIPFTLLWLFNLFLFQKTKKSQYLIFAALSLGFGYYSYKGMRSAVPIWALLTCGYIFYLAFSKNFSKKVLREALKYTGTFALTIAPFFMIIPLLELKYAGAVTNGQSLSVESVYTFFNFYLGNFDPAMLFIRGDIEWLYTTKRHGMFLLSALPFFLVGLYRAIRNKQSFWPFLVISFFLAPLLYGFVGSVFAHRLMFFVPFYGLFTALGFMTLFKMGHKFFKLLLLIIVVLAVINYADFLSYYWLKYPAETKHLFYQPVSAYETLEQEAALKGLEPFFSKEVAEKASGGDDNESFRRAMFFPVLPKVWTQDENLLPQGAILLSFKNDLQKLKKLDLQTPNYYFYIQDQLP